MIRIDTIWLAAGSMGVRADIYLGKAEPKRCALLLEFPCMLVHHEPDKRGGCGCALKRIGEGVSEKFDCTSGVFTVARHIRGDVPASAAGE